uniref:Uncharacterized protein n=1 Tax=Romanomermis culicivorax TaxID=13658 RepID=A0A915JX39_ROMCU
MPDEAQCFQSQLNLLTTGNQCKPFLKIPPRRPLISVYIKAFDDGLKHLVEKNPHLLEMMTSQSFYQINSEVNFDMVLGTSLSGTELDLFDPIVQRRHKSLFRINMKVGNDIVIYCDTIVLIEVEFVSDVNGDQADKPNQRSIHGH